MGASDEVSVSKPRADNFNCCDSLLQIQQESCLKFESCVCFLFSSFILFFAGGVLNIDSTSFTFWCSFIKKLKRKWVLALELFEEALPSADLPAFGAVIAACASAGRWRQVICLLEDMRRLDIEPDLACKTVSR